MGLCLREEFGLRSASPLSKLEMLASAIISRLEANDQKCKFNDIFQKNCLYTYNHTILLLRDQATASGQLIWGISKCGLSGMPSADVAFLEIFLRTELEWPESLLKVV